MNLGRLDYNLHDGDILKAKPLLDIKEIVNDIATAVENIDTGGGEGSSSEGEKGDSPINCYKWFAKDIEQPNAPSEKVEVPSASGWSKYAPAKEEGTDYLWMSSNTKSGNGTILDNWSLPIKISGDDGDNGTDGNSREWIYNYKDTDYNLQEGTVDGHALPSDKPYNEVDDFVPNTWSDRALAVEDTQGKRTVYASWRDKNKKTGKWGEF